MFRRLTSLALAAALIGATSTTGLSSTSLKRHDDRRIELAVPFLADAETGYVDCAEILIGRNLLILRDGKVVVLQPGMTSDDLMKVIQDGRPMFDDADADLFNELVRTGRVRFNSSKRSWPSMPAGELLPKDKQPRDLIGAACGIPPGMTFLAPAIGDARHRDPLT